MKNERIRLDQIQVHRYANLMPMHSEAKFISLKNSIDETYVNVRIKVVLISGTYWLLDGRNRLKASIELGLTDIPAEVYDNITSSEMLRMVRDAEVRRHQSAGTLAVSAWKYMNEEKTLGNKMNQQEAAVAIGADYRLVSIVNKLHTKYGRADIVALIAEGKKINISQDESPFLTDNLRSIEQWVKKQSAAMITTSVISSVMPDNVEELTIEQEAEIINIVEHAKKKLNGIALKELNKQLFITIKSMEVM